MGKSLSLQSTVRAGREQVSSVLGDEVVILNLQKGLYFGLDPVGASIWNRIQEPVQVAEMVHGLQREFDVDAKRCEQDVLTLLQELEKNGLVEVTA